MATVGEVVLKGHLELRMDPEAWIKNNLASRLALVKSLTLTLYDVEEIGESICELTQLIRLMFYDVRSLKRVPNTITRLHKLEHLRFFHCYCLEELPANIGQLVSLTHLELYKCNSIKYLPNSIANLSNLTSLSIKCCRFLGKLPANIGQLGSLTHLDLYKCNIIKYLPNSIANLSKLTTLSLSSCQSLVELPINIGQLVSLTHLHLYKCNSIKYLPNSIANLSKLTTVSLSELPINIGQLVSLTHLKFVCCNNIKSLPMSLANLSNLTSLSFELCESLTELPSNLGQMKSLSHLKLIDCCPRFLPTGLNNLKYLDVVVCSCSDESFLNLKDIYTLQRLSISGCSRHSNSVIKVPACLNQFVNLQVLSFNPYDPTYYTGLVELPANLDGLAHLCLIDIRFTSMKCLPWSIMKLHKLRHLMLPTYFRLQTLPYDLNNSVFITVQGRHARKSWGELKTEIGQLPDPFGGEIRNYAAQNPFIMFPPGYLQLEGNPSQWYISNNDSQLVQFLDLEYVDEELTDSITQFSELTHLYITGHICLPDNYFDTFTRLTHLSLNFSVVEIDDSVIHSLSKLSNLETLHLDLCKSKSPENFSLPVRLTCLSLENCKDMRSLSDGLSKLSNLKILNLHNCDYCESLPPNLNLAKFNLSHCSSKSLPIGLHHLEISPSREYFDKICFLKKYWNQLVSLETLSITCSEMEFLPEEIARLRNLQKLQLKDCVSLKKLPSNIHQLVNLHTLDISVTGIKTLPLSFVKQCKLKQLTLPKCFNVQSLPGKLKKVSIIDDTEEVYCKCMDYDESKDEETELGVVPGEICNEDNNVVSTVEIHETVPDEQTSADPFNSISTGYIEHITIEQGGVSQIYKEYNSPKEMPDNINVVNPWLKYDCSMQSPPKGLMKAEHLKISLCKSSKELLANLKESMNLLHLAIKDCSQHHVKKFPTNFNELANLKTLSIRCIHIESLPSFAGLCSLLKLYIGGVEKLPADLDKLDKLLAVDIHDTKIKCLPWSIKKIQKLRFLNLPLDFRLETLPCQLIESVIITVDCMHIRKTWKELKTEMELLSFRGVGVDETQKFSTISSSGYLQLKDDPGLWIMKNKDLCLLVQSLEIEWPVMLEIGDSIAELRKLTHLYISGNINLDLKHLSGISKTLTHLSLQHCNNEFQSDSLGKLSNLEFLCLDLGDTNLPSNLDMLVNLRHLSLRHGSKNSNIDSMENLSKLKALDLFQCDLESLPENLNLAALKLSGSNIRSLPTSLHRLEILHDKGRCERTKCDVASLNLKQLINMEKLSVTCNSMELLPSIERLQNLQELQLKDCFSLEVLPYYLGKLVKLCTLDISGTRIKSLPDSIISNLKHLILPKWFQQDWSLKYPNKGFITVTIDEIVELYFDDLSDDDDDCEPSMEISCDEQTLPHNLHAIQVRGDRCYNKGETSNPSGESSHAMQNTITAKTEQEFALACDTKEIDCGDINHHALESEQNHIPQSKNVRVELKRKDITLEMLQPFWSNHTTLEDTADELGVSRSTLKRRIKELKVKWIRKGKKQQLDTKKRKLNNKAPFGSDCSHQNLVNLGNSAAHAENVEECIVGSDLHTLPNHVSSDSNVVINLTPDATMETIRGNLMETIDSHQGAEVHLDGANERTRSDNLPQNEKSSNFIVKATYKDDTIKFKFSLSKNIDQLKEEVGKRLDIKVSTFKLKYQDEEKEWILVTCISDLEDALNLSRSSNNTNVGSVVRLLVVLKA